VNPCDRATRETERVTVRADASINHSMIGSPCRKGGGERLASGELHRRDAIRYVRRGRDAVAGSWAVREYLTAQQPDLFTGGVQ